MEAYFEAKRRLFVEPDVGRQPPARGRQRRRRARPPAGRRAARASAATPAHVRPRRRRGRARRGARADAVRRRASAPTAWPSARACAAASTSRTSSARSPPRGCSGIEDDAIVRGVEHVAGVPGRFEAVDEGQPFAVLVDYAHTPEALENVLAEARRLAAGRADLRLRLRRRPRPRRSGRSWARSRRRLADRRHRHLRQPAQRGPARDHRRDPRRHGRARGRGRARPGGARSRARSRRRSDGDVVVIAGKGHEQGQEFARPDDSRSTTARSPATRSGGRGAAA